MALFSSGKYSTLRVVAPQARKMVIPDGSWVKCRNCGQTLYTDKLEDNLNVCWNCNCHLSVNAPDRIKQLADAGSFEEFDAGMKSVDLLEFVDSKPYSKRLVDSESKTGLSEAIICGKCTIDGKPCAMGVMDFRFMGASMGSVVGEKIVRLVERAIAEKLPVIMVTASGGARMQEGVVSLMQMAKTCGAFEKLAEAGLPYIAVLTNPTYGGVSASFATIADIIMAEPEAMIGFAGQRVIAETTNAKLPENFQKAEFLWAKGLIDRVTERKNLRKELGFLLDIFKN